MPIYVEPSGCKMSPSQFNHFVGRVLGVIDENLFYYFDDKIGFTILPLKC